MKMGTHFPPETKKYLETLPQLSNTELKAESSDKSFERVQRLVKEVKKCEAQMWPVIQSLTNPSPIDNVRRQKIFEAASKCRPLADKLSEMLTKQDLLSVTLKSDKRLNIFT
jgi:hypothetical protein